MNFHDGKNNRNKKETLILATIILIIACSYIWINIERTFRHDTPVRIGINPWPGYEFLYLADKLGFFQEAGINVRLVEFSSLQDVRQAFERGQVDAMCSTLVEVLQAHLNTGRKSKIVLVADYSDGADVIIARDGISDVSSLKGKRVAVEPLSLGAVVLSRALHKHDLDLSDVDVMNLAAVDMEERMRLGQIDAAVTYPPFSLGIKKISGTRDIFNTTSIPFEIIDVVSIDPAIIEKNPLIAESLRIVWSRALSYAEKHKDEAYRIMAAREGISPEEFEEALKGIKIVTAGEQNYLFEPGNETLDNSLLEIEKIIAGDRELFKKTQSEDFIFRKKK